MYIHFLNVRLISKNKEFEAIFIYLTFLLMLCQILFSSHIFLFVCLFAHFGSNRKGLLENSHFELV